MIEVTKEHCILRGSLGEISIELATAYNDTLKTLTYSGMPYEDAIELIHELILQDHEERYEKL